MASWKSNRARSRPAVAVLLVGVLLTGPAAGQDAPADDAAPAASFQFDQADTQAVLAALEELYGVRFRVDVELPETITLDSRQPVTAEEMVRLLDEALRRHGAVTRRENGVIRLVPLSLAAAKVDVVILEHAEPDEVAQILNEIFSAPDLLRETTAQNAELVERLIAQLNRHGSPLLTGQMKVTAVPYPRIRAVVLRAPEVSIGAIRQFIREELDRPSPKREKTEQEKKLEEELRKAKEELQRKAEEEKRRQQEAQKPPEKQRVYRLDYVPADDVARTAQQLYGVRPHVEERINALILRTRDYGQFEQLAELIELLDVPEASARETYHIMLNNATARQVQNTLNQLYRQTLRLPYTAEGLEALTAEQRQQRLDEATGLLVEAGVAEEQARQFVTGSLGIPYGAVEVIADEANNALLIQTHPRNIDEIVEVIAQLDRPRGQVMIKVFIAEVTLDNTLETGVDFVYQDIDEGENRRQSYSMDFDVSPTAPGLTYTYISENIEAFIRALQASSRLDVISRPQVLTLDNQEAVVEFGRRVPLIQTTRITDEGTTTATITYEDVVTRLRVTPHVNAAGFIRLDILQTIDDVSPDTFAITEQLAPRILVTRRAQTQAQVRDGQTVCLGGFIGDTIEESEQKIPLLGDIPVLGRAFSSIRQTRVKSELLIFITPYILRTPEELLSMTNEIRGRTVATRRRDRPAEELYIQGAPQENPHRGWQRTSRHYTIPGFDPDNPPPAAPAEPVTPPAPQTAPAPTTRPTTTTAPATTPAGP